MRATYYHEAGYGRSFDSQDLPRLVGGVESDDFSDARAAAGAAVQFHLETVTDETGKPAPGDVTVEHYVPAESGSAFAGLPLHGEAESAGCGSAFPRTVLHRACARRRFTSAFAPPCERGTT